MTVTEKFLSLLENRTKENKETISLLMGKGLIGNAISVLRQEIDTFIRVIYLAKLHDYSYREHLMNCTLQGDQWANKGKRRRITDREMVDIANQLKGYVQYAYKFGCSFIHLSDSHNYREGNPFERLSKEEQNNIAFYLNSYHGYPLTSELSIKTVAPLVVSIFDKISSNMWHYTKHLEHRTILTDY